VEMANLRTDLRDSVAKFVSVNESVDGKTPIISNQKYVRLRYVTDKFEYRVQSSLVVTVFS
jgi:hypothetical protein